MTRKVPEILYNYVDFERPVAELIAYLQRVVDEYPDAYIDEISYPYSDSSHYAICRMRPENSEEERARLAEEKKWKEEREKNERAEFERLKKKFSEKSES